MIKMRATLDCQLAVVCLVTMTQVASVRYIRDDAILSADIKLFTDCVEAKLTMPGSLQLFVKVTMVTLIERTNKIILAKMKLLFILFPRENKNRKNGKYHQDGNNQIPI
jgi:hypothetical protein